MPIILEGADPMTDVGHTFESSVWRWSAIWEYCDTLHADIADKHYSYDDDTNGLNADAALELSTALYADIMSGRAAEYVTARELILLAADDKPCDTCDGTGVRSDRTGYEMGMPEFELADEQAMKLNRKYGWCNECFGEGITGAWHKGHRLSVVDIELFANFLSACGGFEIN